jgi:hypothetical protein
MIIPVFVIQLDPMPAYQVQTKFGPTTITPISVSRLKSDCGSDSVVKTIRSKKGANSNLILSAGGFVDGKLFTLTGTDEDIEKYLEWRKPKSMDYITMGQLGDFMLKLNSPTANIHMGVVKNPNLSQEHIIVEEITAQFKDIRLEKEDNPVQEDGVSELSETLENVKLEEEEVSEVTELSETLNKTLLLEEVD